MHKKQKLLYDQVLKKYFFYEQKNLLGGSVDPERQNQTNIPNNNQSTQQLSEPINRNSIQRPRLRRYNARLNLFDASPENLFEEETIQTIETIERPQVGRGKTSPFSMKMNMLKSYISNKKKHQTSTDSSTTSDSVFFSKSN